MQGTSQLYQTLLADPSSMVQWQAEIAGVIYSQDRIVSCSVSNQLFSAKTLSVGSCCGAEIDLSIRNPGEIPRMAEIDLFARLSGKAGESEWIPKGVFYIDTREVDNRENSGNTNDIMTIHGYDAMLKAEQVYLQQGDVGTWPRAMTTVVNEICTRMEVELDSQDGAERELSSGVSKRLHHAGSAGLYWSSKRMKLDYNRDRKASLGAAE